MGGVQNLVEKLDQDARQLLAYGYVLSQADVIQKFNLELREALAVPPKFERMQKALTELTEMTGVFFLDAVLAGDQFNV